MVAGRQAGRQAGQGSAAQRHLLLLAHLSQRRWRRRRRRRRKRGGGRRRGRRAKQTPLWFLPYRPAAEEELGPGRRRSAFRIGTSFMFEHSTGRGAMATGPNCRPFTEGLNGTHYFLNISKFLQDLIFCPRFEWNSKEFRISLRYLNCPSRFISF